MVFPFPTYDPVLIIPWSSFPPNLNAAGSSNGLSEVFIVTVASDTKVFGVTVAEVVLEPLQHKSLVLVIFVNGSVGTLNDEV